VKDQKDFQQRVQRIGDLVGQLDDIRDPTSRIAARELVQLLMELHGTGLERMMEVVFEAGEPGERIINNLGRDELVSSLLILHGLHPDDHATRVVKSVDRVRPSLRKAGAELELLSVESGAVRVKIETTSHSWGSTTSSLRTMVEEAIYGGAPDTTSLVVEGLEEKPASGFVALESLLGSGLLAPASATSSPLSGNGGK